jgi:uncharacterized membrane protein
VKSDTSRIEAFSDGVFAVAATLLVLQISVPKVGQDLLRALAGLWPEYAAYAVSFLTIGIIWVNHHQILRHLQKVDRTLLFLNLILLMTVALIPFTTDLLSTYLVAGHQDNVAAAVYGAVMTGMSVAFSALWAYAVKAPDLIREPGAGPGIGRFSVGMPVYAAASLLSLLSGKLGLVMYAVLALLYALAPLAERGRSGRASDA